LGDPVGERTDGPELSLKLYHAGKLSLSYQQLIAEAPSWLGYFKPFKKDITMRN